MLLALTPPAFAADLPGDSIYQLDTPLTLQDGRAARLDMNRRQPVVISMFYGSCSHVCPALIVTIKQTEKGLPAAQQARLRVLMVSLDPQRDIPGHLHTVAERHRVDLSRWSLTQAPEGEVRKLAAALGNQYRKLSDGNFNHSTIITLLDSQGRIEAQTSLLGRMDPLFVARLNAATIK